MNITIEAVFENGVFKPVGPVPLKEHERVQLTIVPRAGWASANFGILGWRGSAEDADRFALDSDLAFPSAAEDS
jgi:predicted DNA-binding antitoxin AbrB/MazE fold protein